MRHTIYGLVLALVIIALSSLPIEVLGASAPTFSPGVKAGDSWSYGSFECVGAGCPTGFGAITSLAITVQSVIGPTVTTAETFSFANGTVRSGHFIANVQTGFGNGSIITVAGGLGAGNPINTSPFAPTINSTISKVYAGRQRSVNIIEFSNSFGVIPGVTAILWDQHTGILLEIFVAQSSFSGPGFMGPPGFAEHAVLQSTNLWSSENKPHFSLSMNSFFLSAPQGPPVTTGITATSFDLSRAIGLTTSVFPAGTAPTATTAATVTASKDGSATATLTISTANAFIRYYIVSVTGSSGTRSDTIFLIVNATTT